MAGNTSWFADKAAEKPVPSPPPLWGMIRRQVYAICADLDKHYGCEVPKRTQEVIASSPRVEIGPE